jgi:hypothetical protein
MRGVKVPLRVRMKVDTVGLYSSDGPLRAAQVGEWLDHVNAEAPHLLRNIERLELKCVYVTRHDVWGSWNAQRLLKLFPALEILLITVRKSGLPSTGFFPSEQRIENVVSDIEKKARDWLGKDLSQIPRLVVREGFWDFGPEVWSFLDEKEMEGRK